MYKKRLKCIDCGYINMEGDLKCAVCGGSSFSEIYIEKDKQIYYLLGFLILFMFVYFGIINKRKPEDIQSHITFVSERLPSNYYTYLYSLRQMKSIKNPDSNDINAITHAFIYNDKMIRKEACSIFKKWNKKEFSQYKIFCL